MRHTATISAWLSGFLFLSPTMLCRAQPSATSPANATSSAEWRAMVEADWVRREPDFSVASTRALIQRGRKLAHRLRPRLEGGVWTAHEQKLSDLEGRLAAQS